MKCPHCLTEFHDDWIKLEPFWDKLGQAYYIRYTACPACGLATIYIKIFNEFKIAIENKMVHPKGVSRSPLPKEVPPLFGNDYKEACLVLSDSPKASAALSRRCLQNLLRDVAKVPKGNLNSEIDAVLATNQLPAQLAQGIDAIRQIGNFAAHPIKFSTSGQIADVEEGEAEWSLDVIEGLFDFYFVQPAILQMKRDALNKKLAAVGKPPIK